VQSVLSRAEIAVEATLTLAAYLSTAGFGHGGKTDGLAEAV
jgi:hypothetical protein